MINAAVQKYLQYSKRIAIFGIAQWAIIAMTSLIAVLLSQTIGIIIDDFAARIVNNIVTCSSTLAVAICSGYYAHSAYDNNLNRKINSTFKSSFTNEEESVSNG